MNVLIVAATAGEIAPFTEYMQTAFLPAGVSGGILITGVGMHDKYLDIFEMGFIEKNTTPYISGKLITPLQTPHEKISLKHVSGLTVNTVSGNERTIKLRQEKYNSHVESMEGVALHYVCLKEHVPFAQVRAISNYVIPRDKSQWKMKEAVINLNNWLIDFIKSL